jgi:hypothetical protein
VTKQLVRAILESSDDGLDLLLTDAAVQFACHLRFRRVDPVALDPNWNMGSDFGGVDPVILLSQAIDRGRIYEALEQLKLRYPLASYAYFLIFMLTPPAPKVNFKPCVVDTRRISTPFWFFMMLAEAPPPTVAPVPAV